MRRRRREGQERRGRVAAAVRCERRLQRCGGERLGQRAGAPRVLQVGEACAMAALGAELHARVEQGAHLLGAGEGGERRDLAAEGGVAPERPEQRGLRGRGEDESVVRAVVLVAEIELADAGRRVAARAAVRVGLRPVGRELRVARRRQAARRWR